MNKRTLLGPIFLGLTLIAMLSCSKGNAVVIPEPEKTGLKVMSYNIHIANPPSKEAGFVDLNAIAEVIKKEQPDLVALQEVDRFTTRSGKDSDQAKEIATLTGMHYYFAKALNRSDGEYGVAVLSKFPIENSKVVSLPVNSGTGAELRALGIIEITLKNNQKVVFASVHLDHISDSNRELQAREVLKALDAYKDYPVILGGDFNMNPQNAIWNIIKEQFVMGCTSCPNTFSAINPSTTIDYLLLNKKASAFFSIKGYYTIPERYASDHLPLVIKLEY